MKLIYAALTLVSVLVVPSMSYQQTGEKFEGKYLSEKEADATPMKQSAVSLIMTDEAQYSPAEQEVLITAIKEEIAATPFIVRERL